MRPGADHEELLVRLREENAALRAALTRGEGGQELATAAGGVLPPP